MWPVRASTTKYSKRKNLPLPVQLSFFCRKKTFKLASVASIYSRKPDILERKLNALKSFNSKTECKENRNLTCWGPPALWGHFTCNGLEAQVHFLEILKFKLFLKYDRCYMWILFWNYCWNIIFTCLWYQLKFNISWINSNKFDFICEILYNKIKISFWNF